MDAKDIRNIQEAYLGLYQEQELEEGAAWLDADNESSRQRKPKTLKTREDRERDRDNKNFKIWQKQKQQKKSVAEKVDIYDIILSHLLDEGYAETPEEAEKIMVNMSEEWRDSIVEAKKKVKIHTDKPIEYKIADIGPGKKEYNVKTSKGWRD
jgi:hypothetical protein